MIKIDKFATSAFSGILALGLVMAATQVRAGSVPQVVQVVKVEGSAEYSVDGRTWNILHEGDVLKPGAVIRTAERSLVDVMLGDEGSTGEAFSGPNLLNIPGGGAAGAGGGGGGGGGGGSEEQKANIVRIFQSTVLGVDKLTLDRTGVDEVSETQLDLRAGQIMANVKKLSAQSRYEIKVPNGVAGIRGSVPIISSSLKCGMVFGSMMVSMVGSDGGVRVFQVNEHQMFDPATLTVSDIPGATYQQWLDIYHDMSPYKEKGPSTQYHDRTCRNPCPIDGTAL